MTRPTDEHWNGRSHLMPRRGVAKDHPLAAETEELLLDVAAHSAGDPASQGHSERAKALLEAMAAAEREP